MLKRGVVKAVGFDLDGTLYRASLEIDGRIRDKMAEYILAKRADLIDVKGARKYFEKRYAVLESGSKILGEVGYTDAGVIVEKCLAEADVLDLIPSDPQLARIMKVLSEQYQTFLITSSPQDLGYAKLDRLGISPAHFHTRVFSDTPNAGIKRDGSAFHYALAQLDNIRPEECVYVGDRKSADIEPADKLGMQTIAVWSDMHQATISIPNIRCLEEVFT